MHPAKAWRQLMHRDKGSRIIGTSRVQHGAPVVHSPTTEHNRVYDVRCPRWGEALPVECEHGYIVMVPHADVLAGRMPPCTHARKWQRRFLP